MEAMTDEAATAGGTVDLRPVIEPDLFDIRVSLASLVHWADSQELRRSVMAAIDFPVDDMPMFLVVNQLSYRGATSPSRLASILGTGRANLTKIAHRLEAAGLVVRVPAPGDERSVLLTLTPAGRVLGERIMSNAQRNFDVLLAHWSPKDVDVLNRTLARLAKDANATDGSGRTR
jgi:DNA-binding MarR family transcriptional regulator